MALKSINTGSEPHQSLLIGHMSVHESRDTGNIEKSLPKDYKKYHEFPFHRLWTII